MVNNNKNVVMDYICYKNVVNIFTQINNKIKMADSLHKTNKYNSKINVI